MKSQHLFYILSALLIGIFSAVLSIYGNPVNTGICISCFMENYAGALKLHDNIFMQYLRPEITFIVIGSFALAVIRGEFKPRLSPSFIPYFLGGFFMIVGSAVFIGCPIKMLLRLAGGDVTSLAGIAGLIAGVYFGVMVLKEGVDTSGFTQKSVPNKITAAILPLMILLIGIAAIVKKGIFPESQSGAGAEKAPLYLAVIFSIIIGITSQYSRFCVTGSLRNSIILKKGFGWIALFLLVLSALLVNIFSGRFNFVIYGQPGSHTAYFWSFGAMFLTGYIAVLIDGCPFRQLIKSGEGDLNAQLSFLGMLIGAAFVQNFQILSDASGPTLMGKLGLLAGFLIFSLITIEIRKNSEN
ncbi:MAG: YedE family putative selenium transporter [bacterium]